jgi:hypothetical protein
MTTPTPADFKSGPVEISAERFNEMLNILPPMKWRGSRGQQTFMMCEFTYADITTIFCCLGERYFEMSDSFTLTHQNIVERCALLAWPTKGVVPS